MLLTTIFYHADNFCNELGKVTLPETSPNKAGRKPSMRPGEILTIHIFFQHSKMRTFKDYYKIFIKGIYRTAFGKVVSYNRFVELINENMAIIALFALALMAKATGVSFIDSTSLAVCNNKRIHSHKVLNGLAQRGKTSMGWFFGFKLHFVINDYGEILAFTITTGNVDDRNPQVMEKITKDLLGKLFGDRGYISRKLFEDLFTRGLELITKLKRNMANILMSFSDKLLLRHRGIIESVINVLKNTFHLEHTRHRSVRGFFCNIFAYITAYAFHDSKPSLSRANKCLASNVIA